MHEPSGANVSWPARLMRSVVHMGKALRYSVCGLAAGARLSLAFRQEILGLIVLSAALAGFDKTPEIWLLCLGCWLLVMVGELINTAIEEALDLITKDFCLGVKYAKDMASAAVFLLVLFNIALWCRVFGGDLLALLRGA